MYTWAISQPAREELDGLPLACSEALMAFLDALVFDPMDFARTADEPPDKPHRTVAFGSLGLVSFLVMDWEELVWVTRVNWLG